MGEDVYFCHRAKQKGFKCWVATGVQLGHVGQKVYTITDSIKTGISNVKTGVHVEGTA